MLLPQTFVETSQLCFFCEGQRSIEVFRHSKLLQEQRMDDSSSSEVSAYSGHSTSIRQSLHHMNECVVLPHLATLPIPHTPPWVLTPE